MSTNNHALIRYRTIDRCLKGGGVYHLQDLIRECSDAVSNYREDVGQPKLTKQISRRTLLYDLKFMKDEIHGFGAPIESDRSDGYLYGDPGFEIFRAKISRTDQDELKQALYLLKNVSGQAEFIDLESAITRIEETYRINENRNAQPIILFEHSTNIEGQKWVNHLKKIVQKKKSITVKYQPFDEEVYNRVVSPYLIKEYNNRWFLIGYEHSPSRMTTLGLDRIREVGPSLSKFHEDSKFKAETYLNDVIGVSLSNADHKIAITFKAFGKQRHYINTKPIHKSQKVLEMNEDYGIFLIEVIPNYELKSKLYSFGHQVEILSPESIRVEVIETYSKALHLYRVEY